MLIDDIEITDGPISSNDQDTEVYEFTSQPAAGTIFSTDDTPGEAVDVFNFYIEDQGTSDGLATVVTNLRITPAASNTADWTDHIQGITLSEGATPITIGTPVITDASIDIPISAGDLDVADGAARDLTLAVYVNTSNIVDQAILSFQIAATNDNLTADAAGSDFASTFLFGDVISNDFTIDVFGTELAFSQQPSDVQVNTVMAPDVLISSVDENGNLDTEFDGSGFDISISSTGTLAGTTTLTQEATAGTATFDDIEFTADQVGVTITATDASGLGLTSAVSDLFDVTAAPVGPCFTESFANIPTASSTSYLTRNWTGDDGSTGFTATDARTDQTITSNAITIRTGTLSATISGGIASITLTTQRVFTGGTGNLDVRINGGSVGSIPYSASVQTSSITGINIAGTYTLEIVTPGGGDRIAIDDLSIECFVPSGPCATPNIQASALLVTPQDVDQIDGSFTLSGDADSYLVIRSDDATLDGTPVDVTTYSPGDALAPGDTVVSFGTTNSFSATGLISGTGYTFFVIAANNATCSGGPLYLDPTAGAGVPSDFAYTDPSAPENLSIDCITGSAMTLSWDAPAGGYDNMILVVRENATPHSLNTIVGVPSAFDPDITLAPTFGTTTPNSRIVYVGNATTATVTGLTPGLNYRYEVYAFVGTTPQYSDDGTNATTRSADAQLEDVSLPQAAGIPGGALLNWVEAGDCIDEVMVVLTTTAGLTFAPVGTGFTANSVYSGAGDQVVYLGNGTNASVSNLASGTEYFFEIYVRSGATWSTGVEVSASFATDLNPGDLVIVGYDNNIGGGDDKFSLTNLVDIEPGTEFVIANAVYEAGAAAGERTDRWYSADFSDNETVESQKLTYIGSSTLARGSIICFETPVTGSGSSLFATNITINGSAATSDFRIANNGGAPDPRVNISTSSPDAIFLMQGLFQFFPIDQYATFTGDVLGGIQDGGTWFDLTQAATSGTRISRIHPDIECLYIQGTTSPQIGFAYFSVTPADRIGSQRVLLSRIIDFASFWIDAGGSAGDDLPSVACDATFTVSGSVTAGQWVGGAATDPNNWYDCQNWDNFQVPDSATDVLLDRSVTTLIPNTATTNAFSDRFNDTAVCRNLTLANGLDVENDENGDVLVVYGDLEIGNGCTVDVSSSGGSVGGTIILYGDWTNNSVAGNDGFNQGDVSTVIFNGSSQQTLLDNNDTENFANLTLNNPAGLLIQSPVDIMANLTFVDGILTTATGGPLAANLSDVNLACLAFEETGSFSGASDTSHVDGVVELQGAAGGLIPIGDGTQLHQIRLGGGGSSGDAFRVEYFPANPKTTIGNNTDVAVGFVSPYEYWQLERTAGSSSRNVALQYQTSSGIISPASAYVIRWNGSLWEQAGGNGNANILALSGASLIESAPVGTFSPFSFADNGTSFPVEWLSFTATPAGRDVRLEWETAREVNHDRFVIERSVDGRSFVALGSVPGNGGSDVQASYRFVDTNPHHGINHYRLKQVDLDGSVSYSEVRTVTFAADAAVNMFQIFPNPTEGDLQVLVNLPEDATIQLSVIDGQGRLVLEELRTLSAGEQQVSLETTSLADGMYVLRLQSNGQQLTQKFVKR